MTDEVIDAPELIETETLEAEAEATGDMGQEVEDELNTEEVSDSSPEEEEKPEAKPKVDPVQKRIDELTKARRQAERDSEYWREQAQRKEPEKPVDEPLKTRADFDYDEGKYQEHLFAKARADAVSEARRVLEEEKSQQRSSQKVSVFRGREAEFSKSVDDYADVVTDPSLSISQVMADVAMDMDNGPEVLYYLGKNPSLADEISRLSPLSAARELGRIEAKLSTKPATEKVSKAPAPPPKLKPADSSIKKSLDDLEGAAYNEARRKYINSKRG